MPLQCCPKDIASLASPSAWPSTWDSHTEDGSKTNARSKWSFLELHVLWRGAEDAAGAQRAWSAGAPADSDSGDCREWAGLGPVCLSEDSMVGGREGKTKERGWDIMASPGQHRCLQGEFVQQGSRDGQGWRQSKARSWMPSLLYWDT